MLIFKVTFPCWQKLANPIQRVCGTFPPCSWRMRHIVFPLYLCFCCFSVLCRGWSMFIAIITTSILQKKETMVVYHLRKTSWSTVSENGKQKTSRIRNRKFRFTWANHSNLQRQSRRNSSSLTIDAGPWTEKKNTKKHKKTKNKNKNQKK